MDSSADSILVRGTTVVVYGTIIDVGEGEVVSHGHCWATHANPDTSDFRTDLGPIYGTVPFFSTLTSIIPGTKHYVRSYMYDGHECIYGDEKVFEVTAENLSFLAPTINKLTATSISARSSTIGLGSVTFANHGHCWSQTNPPTINDSVTTFGLYQKDTSFTSVLNNLNNGRYYIRGYLENNGQVIYSNTIIYDSEISVKTKQISLNPDDNSVNAEGYIESLGINPIKDRGHCWSEYTSNPNYNNDKTSLGPWFALGSFNSKISGLKSGHTYYIRAYATDGSRVYYGEVKSFIAN